MARAALLLIVLCAALAAPGASAKSFTRVALVGADGGSVELRLRGRQGDLLFAGLAPARPEGGYIRVYPLGASGFVGAPGRFFPLTGAICYAWNQARAPRGCRRSRVALTRASLRLARFRGRGTTLERLRSRHVRAALLPNLDVAFELAFDRRPLRRRAARPRRCIPFAGAWHGPEARRRPSRFCLAPRGAYARGHLYPLGPDPFLLAAPIRPR